MEISWLGRNCFRLRGRDGVVVTDPYPPGGGQRLAKLTANVVTVSCKSDPAYSSTAVVSAPDDRRLVSLDAPGEYEIGGILVTGVASKRADGTQNMIFLCELDGIRVGHLGLLSGPLGAAVIDELKDVDVLLLPVGAGNSLNAAAAADLMTSIDPHIAIPMNYKTESETLDLEPLDRFLKETGSKPEPQPKLQVTRSQLPANLTIFVLQPRA